MFGVGAVVVAEDAELGAQAVVAAGASVTHGDELHG